MRVVFAVRSRDIDACPIRSLDPNHYHDDGTCLCQEEAEGLSVAEVDHLTKIAAAWKAVSDALDDNAAGKLSAGDVCAVGFAMQERLKDESRLTWGDMFRGGPVL